MASYKKEDLENILKKGWVMFDTKYAPKKEAMVNLYSSDRSRYFNPKSGWTSKPINSGKVSNVAKGMISKIRKLVLIDDVSHFTCNIFFFESYLDKDKEVWEMTGVYISDPKLLKGKPGEINKWYYIDEDRVLSSSREEVLEGFIHGRDDKDLNKESIPTIELSSSNTISFSYLPTIGLKMMCAALNPYFNDFETKNKGQLLLDVNKSLEYRPMDKNSKHISRLMWVVDIFSCIGDQKVQCFFDWLSYYSYNNIIKDLTFSSGKLFLKDKELDMEVAIKNKEVLLMLDNYKDQLDMFDFARLAKMWGKNKSNERFLDMLYVLNKKNTANVSMAIFEIYNAWLKGVSFSLMKVS